MPDALVTILVTAATGVVGSLLVTWIGEGIDAARRTRRLTQLGAALSAKKELSDSHPGRIVLDGEVESLLGDVERGNAGRPYWRSLFRYLAGVAILAGGTFPLYLVMWPGLGDNPWLFLVLVIPIAIIFAIESRPIFLRLFTRKVERD